MDGHFASFDVALYQAVPIKFAVLGFWEPTPP